MELMFRICRELLSYAGISTMSSAHRLLVGTYFECLTWATTRSLRRKSLAIRFPSVNSEIAWPAEWSMVS
jgi:hypothetical protein